MDLAALTDDELVEELTTWAGRVAAGEAVLLRLVGELDVRGAWAQAGVASCAHWLSWRLGLSLTTARERVRVARALRELPALAAAFASGRLSYARVRAVTRVATAADEARWVELAGHCTAERLTKAARGVTRARGSEQDPPAEQPKVRSRVSWDDDGDLVLTVRFPAHQGVAVLAALEQHQAQVQQERDTALRTLSLEIAPADAPAGASVEPYVYEEPEYPQLPQLVGLFDTHTPAELAALEAWRVERDRRRALRDAWTAEQERLAQEAAARELPTARATLTDGLLRALTGPADNPHVTVQLLVDPVSGWARTAHDELLPPPSLRQLLRTLPGRATRRISNPRRLDLGRHSRLVSPALRALLGQVDGERCRFPSCTHTRHLHAHHVVFWRNGGPTDLANLILVCSRHHTVVHEQGHQLTLDSDRSLQVLTADGTPMSHRPSLPHAPAGDLPPAAQPTEGAGDAFDLGYIVNVMLAHAA